MDPANDPRILLIQYISGFDLDQLEEWYYEKCSFEGLYLKPSTFLMYADGFQI